MQMMLPSPVLVLSNQKRTKWTEFPAGTLHGTPTDLFSWGEKESQWFHSRLLKISNHVFLCHLVSFTADILCYGRENPIRASSNVDIIHNADQLIPGVSPMKGVAVFYVCFLSCPFLRGQLLI